MRVRKKPITVEAFQWFNNGDHPQDNCKVICSGGGARSLSEGEVVRYFRHPGLSGETLCRYCERILHVHGWIDTPEGGHIVCPGDWIITGFRGEHYPIKNDIFVETYEEVFE